MEKVVLLNNDYNFLGEISWKKAIALIVKGKVEVVKESDKVIQNAAKTVKIFLPKVIRLIKMIQKIYKSKVRFSKKNVIVRDKGTCQYCGAQTSNDITIDHVIPVSRGGKTTFDNCVACCKKCNSAKNNALPSECNMTLLREPFKPTIMEFMSIKRKTSGLDEFFKELLEY